MSMSRIHFKAIATTIHAQKAYMSPQHHYMLASDMADTLQRFNAGFKRAQFLEACGAVRPLPDPLEGHRV